MTKGNEWTEIENQTASVIVEGRALGPEPARDRIRGSLKDDLRETAP